MEASYHPWDPRRTQAQAIVVLGGGTYFSAPEWGGDTVNRYGLERLRYAARLYRETGLPILVTGGHPRGNPTPEALQMKAVLTQDFGVPVKWTEDRSGNTFQNALYSRKILKQAGIDRILLVTHAWHMPRAQMAFEKAGFQVVPAPLGFTTRYRLDILEFVPRAEALLQSKLFFHEAIGFVWYKLKFAFAGLGRKG